MVTLYNDDCYKVLTKLETQSIDLLVTSPPYYNAREYSHWETVEDYMGDMRRIFAEVFRTLKNHHYIVVNVGDIICQVGQGSRTMQKLPLGAMWITMLMDLGFTYEDDYIWDKGEPQSKRHLGNPPYPYYQKPVNCYEHILILSKNVLDRTRLRCPVCGSDNVASDGYHSIGVYGFECKNPNCPQKSAGGRGKRFSARSILMQSSQRPENEIDSSFIHRFRRDIVKITPVIKINCNGENIISHSAPFPNDIPEMAIRYFSCVGDTVVDCFLGSGTTGVVAMGTDRNFIGIELNRDYFNIAEQRLNAAQEERDKKLW